MSALFMPVAKNRLLCGALSLPFFTWSDIIFFKPFLMIYFYIISKKSAAESLKIIFSRLWGAIADC
jgi:hypothetical protein